MSENRIKVSDYYKDGKTFPNVDYVGIVSMNDNSFIPYYCRRIFTADERKGVTFHRILMNNYVYAKLVFTDMIPDESFRRNTSPSMLGNSDLSNLYRDIKGEVLDRPYHYKYENPDIHIRRYPMSQKYFTIHNFQRGIWLNGKLMLTIAISSTQLKNHNSSEHCRFFILIDNKFQSNKTYRQFYNKLKNHLPDLPVIHCDIDDMCFTTNSSTKTWFDYHIRDTDHIEVLRNMLSISQVVATNEDVSNVFESVGEEIDTPWNMDGISPPSPYNDIVNQEIGRMRREGTNLAVDPNISSHGVIGTDSV